jgi:hypothetical protein
VCVYFVGYEFTNTPKLGNLFYHPLYSFGFLGTYLSMPFGGMKSPQFGVWVGLSNLFLGIVLAITAIRNRLWASQPGVVFFGYYLFTVLTALLTSAGRMDPEDPSFSAAKAYRYVTVPLVNWAVFILICIWISSRRRSKILSTPVITSVFLVLFGIGSLKLRWWLQQPESDFSDAQLAELSIENGLMDPLSLRKIFPEPEFVFPLLTYLHHNHLSVFASHRSKWLGQPARNFASKLPGFASGQVCYVFPAHLGLEVVGWADDSHQYRPAQWVLLTNEDDQIVGFGRKLPAGFPRELRAPSVPYSEGWVGFVNFQIRARTYSAYLINRAGLSRLGGVVSAPSINAAIRQEIGVPIPDIRWRKDPAWTLNGIPHANFGAGPPGPIYGSWSGADINTGQIVSSSFPAPANRCLILPVLPGPDIGGQSVEVFDADTGELFAEIPMQQRELVWGFWRLSVPASAKHLRIIARDYGQAWGQWVAISDPTGCS